MALMSLGVSRGLPTLRKSHVTLQSIMFLLPSLGRYIAQRATTAARPRRPVVGIFTGQLVVTTPHMVVYVEYAR